MLCVMCLFANPAGITRCRRCHRADTATASADDDGRVTLDPELRIVMDDDTELQRTENCETLDIQFNEPGGWAGLSDPGESVSPGESPLRRSASPPARG